MQPGPVVAVPVSAYSPQVMRRMFVTDLLPLTAALVGLLLHLLRPARS
jgi:hypothetical protein